MNASDIINLVSALATTAAVVYAAVAVRAMNKQMKQLADQQLTQLSNEHNWNLYERHSELPPAIPAWRHLSSRGWAWRVLHLNHLNLLWLAYKDHQRGLMNKNELEGWIKKARYWFSLLQSESTEEDVREGHKVLQGLLEQEEGFSSDFRRWLLDNEIVL